MEARETQYEDLKDLEDDDEEEEEDGDENERNAVSSDWYYFIFFQNKNHIMPIIKKIRLF